VAQAQIEPQRSDTFYKTAEQLAQGAAPPGLDVLYQLTQGLRPGLTHSAPPALERTNYLLLLRASASLR